MKYFDVPDPLSSSGHILNSDLPLDLYQQKLWFNLNIENNKNSDKELDPNLHFADFRCDIDAHWRRLAKDITPPRKLCNMFWLNLPWRDLENRIGPLRIMDYGCSVGNYALNFMEWTDVAFSYHGFDVRPGDIWEERRAHYSNLNFTQYEGEFERRHFSDEFNFFMSQSAMEHVVHDLTYFQVIADYLSETDKPTIHIHQVPSAACLDLYGLHGVRHYTPRTVSKISKLFPDAICTLFSLGGVSTNAFHLDSITIPESEDTPDWRNVNLDEYNSLMKEAITSDMSSKCSEASFYTIVIETGVSTSAFDRDMS